MYALLSSNPPECRNGVDGVGVGGQTNQIKCHYFEKFWKDLFWSWLHHICTRLKCDTFLVFFGKLSWIAGWLDGSMWFKDSSQFHLNADCTLCAFLASSDGYDEDEEEDGDGEEHRVHHDHDHDLNHDHWKHHHRWQQMMKVLTFLRKVTLMTIIIIIWSSRSSSDHHVACCDAV